jgi:predicted enzyme related to lactoylglutathione lyase
MVSMPRIQTAGERNVDLVDAHGRAGARELHVTKKLRKENGVSSNIRAMIADVEVESLETAIPLYRELAGDVEVRRFPYRDLELALVGPFLLYSGPLENYVSQTATIIVESLDPVLEALSKAGAEVLEAPSQVPNGTRIVARHPDGSVFEYMQPRT